jgi:hypothetical protein
MNTLCKLRQHCPLYFTSHFNGTSRYNSGYTMSYVNRQLNLLALSDHSGGAVKGMNCLRSLELSDHGFESHLRHGYLFVFILCSCWVAALRRADHSSKESYRMT